MERASEVSAIAEISVLNEILLLRLSDSKENFAEAIIEKATRLFGVRRLAILLGEGSAQQLIASLAFRNEKEILDKIDRNKPNYFKFDFVNNGKFGTLFMEQAHPIGARERRLYIIFARQLENALIVAEEAAGRKRAEEALRESEENFRRSLEDSPLGVRIFDAEGETLYANRAILDIYGYASIEELKASPAEKRLAPESHAEHLKRREKRLRDEGISDQFEISIVRKNGEIRHLQVFRKEALWNGKRQFQSIYQDITEHKQAEGALRESEERYRALVDAGAHMGEAIFILQDTDKVEAAHPFANEEWARITGYTAEELRGISYYDVLHPRHRAAVAGRARRRLQEGQDVPGRWEISVITKDGTEVSIEVVGGGAITYHGKLATVGYARDITERKRMEHELREVQEKLIRSERLAAIGQLAGGVGHELRNPLGAIKNAAYYVKGKVARSELSQKEPRVMEFLDIMEDEINSSNKIINDLLGFSRVGKPSVSPAQIKNVIEAALSHMPIPESIKLTKKLDADLPEIEIDADQVQQVLANMITNAVEAMPEGGKLTIAARGKDECLEVEIADTGCGIPQETVGKIFDPLFTTRAKGIGLGLALCKAIIDRHEGYIQVESQVGKGTTFTIKLPLKAK